MAAEDSLKWVKTILIVLFSVIIAATVVLFALFIFAIFSKGDTMEMIDKVNVKKHNLTINLIIVGLYLVEAVVGLIGVLQESLCTTILVTCIGLITFVLNVLLMSWSLLIICSFYTILTAVFANMLYNRGKRYQVL